MSDFGFEEEDFTTKVQAGTLRRIAGLMVPHWRWVLAFLLAIALVSVLESFFTYLNMLIIDEAILKEDTERLITLVTVYGSLIFFQAIGVLGFIALTGILGQRVQYDLRKKMFKHLQELSLSYYNRTPVGWIMSRVTSDSERIAELVTWGLLDLTWAIMNVGTAIIFMMVISWQLALVVALSLPVLIFAAIWFKKRILLEYREARKFNSRITGAYNENITGVRVVQALNRQQENLNEFGHLTRSMYRSSYRAAWYSALFLPAVQLISAFAVGAVILIGGNQVQFGIMTIGGIQAFVTYITFMMWPIQDLARVYASLQHAVASAERAFSLIDEKPAIVNRAGAVDAATITGAIEFDNVSFYYDPEKPVLENFNLNVPAGSVVALVGETGGGKSTIVNLVCRFFEPISGQIRINGIDYTEYTLESLQSRIGVVLQTPHLFSGTIRENIRYGRIEATDEEIEAAARVAGAHHFICDLDNGYDEQVGEGGILLSVGQKQLVSLARAILSDPEIFVMDEATSSVDTLTENLIQHGMEKIMEGRTSFVIAHRLSTIRQADLIVVIHAGKIAEMGSHQALLQKREHYYQLYTKQFKREYAQNLPEAQGAFERASA
jgi:ATP-binding cassette, subfamily B, bacterial